MTRKKIKENAEKLAILCAQSAKDKLAENTIILNLQDVDIASCDYFVICDCKSTVQVKSVTENILNQIIDHQLTKPKIEGLENAEWVILDFFDVVVHIFVSELRDYYKLEKLWSDAKFYTVSDDADLIDSDYSEFMTVYENSKIENE